MRAAARKENVDMFFYFLFWRNYVILKVERRKPDGPDRWAGPGTSRPNVTRPALSFIITIHLVYKLVMKYVKCIVFF